MQQADVKNLKLSRFFHVARRRSSLVILGAGGIGANFIYHVERNSIFHQKKLFVVYDSDTVELSNLNRVPQFTINDAADGMFKVEALKRRFNLSSLTVNRRNWPPAAERPFGSFILDCTDKLSVKDSSAASWMKLSYDGGSNIAFILNPYRFAQDLVNGGVEEEGQGGYEIVPSFFPPASIVSILGLLALCYSNLQKANKSRYGYFPMNIDEISATLSKPIPTETPSND